MNILTAVIIIAVLYFTFSSFIVFITLRSWIRKEEINHEIDMKGEYPEMVMEGRMQTDGRFVTDDQILTPEILNTLVSLNPNIKFVDTVSGYIYRWSEELQCFSILASEMMKVMGD